MVYKDMPIRHGMNDIIQLGLNVLFLTFLIFFFLSVNLIFQKNDKPFSMYNTTWILLCLFCICGEEFARGYRSLHCDA